MNRGGVLCWAPVNAAAFNSMVALRVCDPLLPPLALEFGVGLGKSPLPRQATRWRTACCRLSLRRRVIASGSGKRCLWPRRWRLCATCSSRSRPRWQPWELLVWPPARPQQVSCHWPSRLSEMPLPLERRQHAFSRLLLATLGGIVCGQCLDGLVGSVGDWRPMFAGVAITFATCSLMLRSSAG